MTNIYICDHATNNLKEICGITHRLLIKLEDEIILNVGDIIQLYIDDDSKQVNDNKYHFDKLREFNHYNDFLIKIHEVGMTKIYLFETTHTTRVYYADIILNEQQAEL